MKHHPAEMDPGPAAKRARTPSASITPSQLTWKTSELFGDEVEVPEAEVELCASHNASALQSHPRAGSDRAVQEKPNPIAEVPSPAREEPLADAKLLIREGSHPGDFFASGDRFHSAYNLGEKIGEGGFGKVFIAIHKISGLRRAVKRLSKSHGRSEARKNEIDALLALDHPHIVRMVEYYDEELYCYLVFELCQGPDLFDRIVKDPQARIMEHDASVALRHILKALQCCHSQYRGHYDIKPENFMYTNTDLKELMMIDLGLSSGFDAHRKRMVGTAAYMAPECRSGIYGPEVDIWSCGVVLFVMLTGQPFLPTVPEWEIAREGQARPLIRSRLTTAAKKFKLSAEVQDLLGMMLQHDRHERPTVREALNHPFTQNSYRDEISLHRLEDSLFKEALQVRKSLVASFRAVAQEPMLKRVARLAIAYAHGASVAQRLAFRQIDQTGFGELSITALEKDVERCGDSIPKDLDSLFQMMDLHQGGYIRYMTFISVTLPAMMLKDETLCRIAFTMLDKNKDGFIDCTDLASVFNHRGNNLACQRCLQEVCHSSQRNVRICWDEFKQLLIANVTE